MEISFAVFLIIVWSNVIRLILSDSKLKDLYWFFTMQILSVILYVIYIKYFN